MSSSPATPSAVRRWRLVVPGPPLALGEVDDERDAVEPVPFPEAVLDEVGVITGEARSAVDLDREPGWLYPDLGHVEHLQPVPLLGRGLPRLRHVGQKPVQLRGGNPVLRASAE